MKEIKIGEYVRTKDGYLGILIAINKQDYNYLVVDTSRNIRNDEYPATYLYLKNENIKKHSKNIIDLIEVGDYVNGYRIDNIINGVLVHRANGLDRSGYLIPIAQYESDIKSIVTKEQFENVEYKVESEDN